MPYTMSQTVLLDITLPSFLSTFKQKCIHAVVPHLMAIRARLNDEQNVQEINPFFILVLLLLVIYVMQSIVWQVFFQKHSETGKSTSNQRQMQQVGHEINELKKQIKSLKTAFTEVISNKGVLLNANLNQQIVVSKQAKTSQEQLQGWRQLLSLFTSSIQNNKALINYVLESQVEVLREIKRMKKHQRDTFSSGRPSTIRSRTSDRKLPFDENCSSVKRKSLISNQKQSKPKEKVISTSQVFKTEVKQQLTHLGKGETQGLKRISLDNINQANKLPAIRTSKDTKQTLMTKSDAHTNKLEIKEQEVEQPTSFKETFVQQTTTSVIDSVDNHLNSNDSVAINNFKNHREEIKIKEETVIISKSKAGVQTQNADQMFNAGEKQAKHFKQQNRDIPSFEQVTVSKISHQSRIESLIQSQNNHPRIEYVQQNIGLDQSINKISIKSENLQNSISQIQNEIEQHVQGSLPQSETQSQIIQPPVFRKPPMGVKNNNAVKTGSRRQPPPPPPKK